MEVLRAEAKITKNQWDNATDDDKLVITVGVGAATGGALLSIAKKRAAPLIIGSLIGIAAISYSIYKKKYSHGRAWGKIVGVDKSCPFSGTEGCSQSDQKPEPKKDQEDSVGAPKLPERDDGPVQTFNGLVSEKVRSLYPMMHRVTEGFVGVDSLDPRIETMDSSTELGPYVPPTHAGFF